jgi:hypothetical protein
MVAHTARLRTVLAGCVPPDPSSRSVTIGRACRDVPEPPTGGPDRDQRESSSVTSSAMPRSSSVGTTQTRTGASGGEITGA